MGLAPSIPSPEELETLTSRLDANIYETARTLQHADVFLLCTGAGFSADSGLAVYKDIAELKAYQDLGLHYHDICRPEWLRHDPELFYGFWGACYNDYRDTEPHDGYRLIRQWRDERFATSIVAEDIRTILKENAQNQEDGKSKSQSSRSSHLPSAREASCSPYPILGRAGAFFVYTSNVDAHCYDHFKPHEVRECHGNIEVWQCGAEAGPCCSGTWRAPPSFHFLLDTRAMRAPRRGAGTSTTSNAPGDENTDPAASRRKSHTLPHDTNGDPGDGVARAGRVRRPFGPRNAALCQLPEVDGNTIAFGPENWPRCPSCGSLARPAVLMFGDLGWVDDAAEEGRWQAWRGPSSCWLGPCGSAVQDCVYWFSRLAVEITCQLFAGLSSQPLKNLQRRQTLQLHA